jgi:hypothetical protein
MRCQPLRVDQLDVNPYGLTAQESMFERTFWASAADPFEMEIKKPLLLSLGSLQREFAFEPIQQRPRAELDDTL